MLKIGITEDFTVIHKDFSKTYYIDHFNALTPLLGKPKALEKLQKLIKKHPDFVPFYSLLISHYKKTNQDKAIFWMQRMYELFPGDLAAKLQMAQYYLLVKEDWEGIYKLFGRNIDLSFAVPNRTLFHFTELMDFVTFCIKTLLKLNRVKDAERKLAEIAPLGMDNPAYQECKWEIDNYKMLNAN